MRIARLLLCLIVPAIAFAQPTPPQPGALTVNSSTGNITAPVTAATFASANGLVQTSAIIDGAHGGTGVANTGKSLTLSGNVTYTGAFNTTWAQTGNANLMLPAGNTTLVGRDTTDTLTNKTISGATNTLSAIPGSALNNNSVANLALANSTISIAGAPTALGGSITLDTIDNGLAASGLIARTGANTRAGRTITGTANQITVTNGDGVSGNPTLSLPTSLIFGNNTTTANLDSITGTALANVTITGGSSGASLTLGQGANGNITFAPTGTGYASITSASSNGTSYNGLFRSLLNGADPASEFNSIQGAGRGPMEAGTFGAIFPSTLTSGTGSQQNVVGIYADSNATNYFTVGLYVQSKTLANISGAYNDTANLVQQDYVASNGVWMNCLEINQNVLGHPSRVWGLLFAGTTTGVMPSDSAAIRIQSTPGYTWGVDSYASILLDNNKTLSWRNSGGTAQSIAFLGGDNNLYLQYPTGQSLNIRTTDGTPRASLDLSGNLSVTGSFSAASIQSTAIGSTTPSTGVFSTLRSTGQTAFGTTISTSQQNTFGGSFTSSGTAIGTMFNPTLTPGTAAGQGYTAVVQGTLNKPSGTASQFAGLWCIAPTIGTGAGGTVTNAATVLINGAPSGATNNYSLQVLAGDSILGGNLTISGTGASTVAGSLTVTKVIATSPNALTYASPTSVDVTAANVFTVTTVNATGSVTFNATGGGTAGATYTFIITNDATSAKTITFGTNFVANGTLTPSGAGKVATIRFISNGTSLYELSRTVLP